MTTYVLSELPFMLIMAAVSELKSIIPKLFHEKYLYGNINTSHISH